MLLGEVRSRDALLRGTAGRRAGEEFGDWAVGLPARLRRTLRSPVLPMGAGFGRLGREVARGSGTKGPKVWHSSGFARGSAAEVDGARRPQGLDCRACGRSRSWALPLAHSYDCTLWHVGVSWNGQDCSGLMLGILGVWLFSGILLVRHAARRVRPAASDACSAVRPAARSPGRLAEQAADGVRTASGWDCSRETVPERLLVTLGSARIERHRFRRETKPQACWSRRPTGAEDQEWPLAGGGGVGERHVGTLQVGKLCEPRRSRQLTDCTKDGSCWGPGSGGGQRRQWAVKPVGSEARQPSSDREAWSGP